MIATAQDDTPRVTWATDDPERAALARTPHTAACGACGMHAPAVDVDADGDPLCGRCAGARRACRTCQRALAPAEEHTPPGDPDRVPPGVWCAACVGGVRCGA